MDKVLIYAMQEGLGGIETYVLNLSRFSDDAKNRYGYIILGEKTIYKEELKKLGVDYFFITHKNKNVLKNIKELDALFKQQRSVYDTIYFNTSGLYYPIPYFLAIKYHYRIVLHSHSTDGAWPKKMIHYINRAWINRYVSVRFACSSPAGRWMFGKNREYKIIPNSIELEKFRFSKTKREYYRKKLEISANSILLGNVGRLSYVKNQVFLIDILVECKRKNKTGKDIKMLLVGDGEDEAKLIKKATACGVENDVIFYGRAGNPEDLLAAMDIFIMPSITEGFPITLIEAQMSGLPCLISSAITDEVNISGNIKFESLEKNAEQWADTILGLKCERYDCFKQLQEKGFDVTQIENKVLKLIIE